MDIKITYKSLKHFVETEEPAEGIAAKVSLCGPTFDRFHKVGEDYVFEIEAITNRIDTTSVFGVARETVAILNQFDVPAKLLNDPYQIEGSTYSELPTNFKITFENKNLVKRFIAVSLTNVVVQNSSLEVQDFLKHCDQRPINNLVDITNELTLLYGMPSHIFDLDKIQNRTLHVRESRPGEVVRTLNGVDNKLKGKDIVIEDGAGRLIDLCGVMGGSLAEVDQNTHNLLLIIPVYDPSRVRKTSLFHQNRTLAAQIYEKSPDPEICHSLANLAIELFQKRAQATVSSPIFDFYPNPYSPKIIPLDLHWLNHFIGHQIENQRVISILSDLGFGGQIKEDQLFCTIPSFRYPDINLPEDLAEEVARIYGYFRLPSQLPYVNLASSEPNRLLNNEFKAKSFLSHLGYHEVFNNSLVSEKLILDCRLNLNDHLKLTNALSSDFEYLRTSLLPSLLINFKNNQSQKISGLHLFELSNIYLKRSKGSLPDEISTLSLISDKDFRSFKGDLEVLFDQLNIKNLKFVPSTKNLSCFAPHATAEIFFENILLGFIGLVSPQVANQIGLDKSASICEINFLTLTAHLGNPYTYRPVSHFPDVVEDLTIKSQEPIGILIEKLYQGSQLITKVEYLTSYQDKHSFKLTFNSPEGNLDQNAVNAQKTKIQSQFK